VVILAVIVSVSDLHVSITREASWMLSLPALRRRYSRASVAYIYSVLIEMVIFLAALYSLATGKDVVPPVWAMWVAVLGLFCAVQVPYLVLQFRLARNALRSSGAGQAPEQSESPQPAKLAESLEQRSGQADPQLPGNRPVKHLLGRLRARFKSLRRPCEDESEQSPSS
jgi:hypothetical protein